MARDVFICDAVRTPIGRYGGALAKVRTDDLAAVPIKALMARHPKVDWAKLEEVYYGCANQAGEDNRNVARMALLLHHDDAEREAAYDREFRVSPLAEALDRAQEFGVHVVSMKRDWAAVFNGTHSPR